MKVVSKFAKVFITLLCAFPLNYGFAAQCSTTHSIGKAQYHHDNKQEHRKEKNEVKKKQTLTFNFLVNLSTSLFPFPTNLRPFTAQPRVIVTTPDGRVFSKHIGNSFDFFSVDNSDNTVMKQIIVKHPSTGIYTLTFDFPISNQVVTVDVNGTNVVASRNNSKMVYETLTFNTSIFTSTQFALYYFFGSASSHIPTP